MSRSGRVYKNETMLLNLHGKAGEYVQSLSYHMRHRQHRSYFYSCMGFYSFVYSEERFMVVFKNSQNIEN